jgi:hypothetical protein
MIVTWADQLACVERELKLRRRLYPRRVEVGRLSQAKADQEIRDMEAVAETLRGLERQERLL